MTVRAFIVTDRPFDWFDTKGPMIVEMIRVCKSLGTLPRPGGLFDQDSLFVHMVTVYDAAIAERQELDQKRQANLAKAKQRGL